jgi:hypothetical protein
MSKRHSINIWVNAKIYNSICKLNLIKQRRIRWVINWKIYHGINKEFNRVLLGMLVNILKSK